MSNPDRTESRAARARALIQHAMSRPWDGVDPVRAGGPADGTHHFDTWASDGMDMIRLVCTFDVGAHNSGWFRNSDYDRCIHVSISGRGGPATRKDISLWAKAFFGEYRKWVWEEPGRYRKDVVHLRLFVDRDNQPILPHGEVYDLKPWKDGSSPEKIYRV